MAQPRAKHDTSNPIALPPALLAALTMAALRVHADAYDWRVQDGPSHRTSGITDDPERALGELRAALAAMNSPGVTGRICPAWRRRGLLEGVTYTVGDPLVLGHRDPDTGQPVLVASQQEPRPGLDEQTTVDVQTA